MSAQLHIDPDTVARVRVTAAEVAVHSIEGALSRHDAPTSAHLVSATDYRLMRGAVTELAALAVALEQPLTEDSLRRLVASAVRRGLGGSI